MALRELEDGIRQLQLRLGEQQTLIAAQQAQLQLSDPVARVEPYAGPTAPAGWLLCDGSAVSRTTYPQLFAAIGTTYGAGNGSTTYNLPNARGRTLVGRDTAQPEFDVLGETGGAKTHTLTTAQMPSHTHTQATKNAGTVTGNEVGKGDSSVGTAVTGNGIHSTGGGGAHNNLQPYLTVNYIIRAA
jgi:microcystin-dependent protein